MRRFFRAIARTRAFRRICLDVVSFFRFDLANLRQFRNSCRICRKQNSDVFSIYDKYASGGSSVVKRMHHFKQMCGGDGTRLAEDTSQAIETDKIYDKYIIIAVFDVNLAKVFFCFMTNFRYSADLS